MQLVRVIEAGIDVDGDGAADLDASRIATHGQSQGGNIGTLLLAVAPGVRVGVLSAVGTGFEVTRPFAGTRPNEGTQLAGRMPSLLNSPGISSYSGVAVMAPHFNENLPLRDGLPLTVQLADGTTQVIQSPVINTVAGAMALQAFIETSEWAFQSGNAIAYAPYLRKSPLGGNAAKSVIYAFALGDQQLPNWFTTAIVRAGDLADRTTFYRHDLAFAEDASVPKNPHPFVLSILSPNPLVVAIARGAQAQFASFFASDGAEIIQPEPARLFEVPISGPLPEGLNWIP
jgi:hypothetical protein